MIDHSTCVDRGTNKCYSCGSRFSCYVSSNKKESDEHSWRGVGHTVALALTGKVVSKSRVELQDPSKKFTSYEEVFISDEWFIIECRKRRIRRVSLTGVGEEKCEHCEYKFRCWTER